MYGFRCKNCGHLVHADHAGEREVPYACPVCKRGLLFGHSIEGLKAENPEVFDGLTEAQVRERTHTNAVAPGVSVVHFADHKNWEVLAEAKPERLKELGVEPKHVLKHAPFKRAVMPTQGEGTHHARAAEDGTGVVDAAK